MENHERPLLSAFLNQERICWLEAMAHECENLVPRLAMDWRRQRYTLRAIAFRERARRLQEEETADGRAAS